MVESRGRGICEGPLSHWSLSLCCVIREESNGEEFWGFLVPGGQGAGLWKVGWHRGAILNLKLSYTTFLLLAGRLKLLFSLALDHLSQGERVYLTPNAGKLMSV